MQFELSLLPVIPSTAGPLHPASPRSSPVVCAGLRAGREWLAKGRLVTAREQNYALQLTL